MDYPSKSTEHSETLGSDGRPTEVEKARETLSDISQGDLRFRPPSSDNGLLLESLDGMVRHLRQVIGRLRRAADAIETMVSEIFRSARTMSTQALEEAEAVNDTFDSMVSISSMMDSVGRGLHALSGLTQSTSASVLKMAGSINEVSQTADALAKYVQETAAAIGHMASSVRRVAESTESLAESAEKTARAVEAIDHSTQQIGESVSDTTELAEEVARSADSGSRLVAETAATMTEIKEAIDAATETITRLGRRSDQIGELTNVITEIADRTNLLAINAAVLAAQAGAQGRGFRIVADEIKELSERTSASTHEIEELIESVRGDVGETIERVALGGEKAAGGVDLVSRASSLLVEIREKTSAASERIRSIAGATAVQASESHTVLEAADLVRKQARDIERATGEQALTSRHIGERATHMWELTEQVRRTTGEQAHVSRQIASAMEELTTVVERIRSVSDEQAGGAATMLKSIENIKTGVLHSQSSLSGVNSAVDLLVGEAVLLKREVEEFQLPVPERGGHIRVGLRASQVVLDPAAISYISRVEIMSNIFEGLVQFGDRAEIRPAMAERWDLSPDNRVYTFYIRESARFHNGRRVRGDDVKYSFERQLRENRDAACRVFRTLEGANEFLADERDDLSGIQVLGDQVVLLRLTRPVAFFLSTLCSEYAYIVPREEIERPGSDFPIKPVGSGPFRVVEPVLGKEIQLERFSNYWDSELPYADRLTVTFGMTPDEILEAFSRGELDYVTDLPLTFLSELKQRMSRVHILHSVQLQTRMLVFDCERPPLSDRRVRQAICYALDRERFLREVYGGMADASRGPIFPGLLGYDPAERGYYHDPARARVLLEEAGYGDGFNTEIWWLQTVTPAVECISDDLARIGITAECRFVSAADMSRAVSLRMVPIAGHDWYADYPDPDNFTYGLFNSANRGPIKSMYSNEYLDQLTETGRMETDPERRAEIYREITKLLLEEAPCAFLAHRHSFVAHRPDLEGLGLRLLSPFVSPKTMWLARRSAGEPT